MYYIKSNKILIWNFLHSTFLSLQIKKIISNTEETKL